MGFFCYALLGRGAHQVKRRRPAREKRPRQRQRQRRATLRQSGRWWRHHIIGFEGITLDRDTAEMMNRYKPGGVWLRESTPSVGSDQ